jgi:hypothetical protein
MTPLLSIIEIGDAIGTIGCYFYSFLIAAGTIFCMVKYLKVDK